VTLYHSETAGKFGESVGVLVGDTGSFPLRYLVSGSKKATPRLNITRNEEL
jgi:hypothetical protein